MREAQKGSDEGTGGEGKRVGSDRGRGIELERGKEEETGVGDLITAGESERGLSLDPRLHSGIPPRTHTALSVVEALNNTSQAWIHPHCACLV